MPPSSARNLPLVQDMQSLLETECFGRRVQSFPSLGSTNVRASTWAAEGAAEGSVVVAEEQTAGRGRHGRPWMSAPAKNLTFSVILRPQHERGSTPKRRQALAPEQFGLITLAGCVAVCDTVETFAVPRTPAAKWPNDVLIDGKKCCGMLLESTLNGPSSTAEAVILGVGLNVNQESFPGPLAASATSLCLEAGRPVPRPPLFAHLLRALERRYTSLFEDEGRAVRLAFEARLRSLGETLTLRRTTGGRPVRGTCRGISADGALRLDTEAGPQTFHAGEITTR